MSFQPLNTNNSNGTNYDQVNSLMRDFSNEKKVKVIKDDEGTRVVILDKNGLRTTAPGSGIDVVTATDDELTSNSNQNIFKIVEKGEVTGSHTYSTGNLSFTITKAHTLGYTPIALVFLDYNGDGSLYIPLPWIAGLWLGAAGSAAFSISATYDFSITSNNIQIDIGDGSTIGGPVDYKFIYFLLQESITTT